MCSAARLRSAAPGRGDRRPRMRDSGGERDRIADKGRGERSFVVRVRAGVGFWGEVWRIVDRGGRRDWSRGMVSSDHVISLLSFI